jgi:hypothetical protein
MRSPGSAATTIDMAQCPYGRSGRHSTARRARSNASSLASASAASFPAVDDDDDDDDSGISFLMKDGSEDDPSDPPEDGKQSADDEETTDGSATMAEVGAWAHDVLVVWSRTASRAIVRTWQGRSARTHRSRWTSDSLFLDRSHEGILASFAVPSAMDHHAKAEGWRRDSKQHRRNVHAMVGRSVVRLKTLVERYCRKIRYHQCELRVVPATRKGRSYRNAKTLASRISHPGCDAMLNSVLNEKSHSHLAGTYTRHPVYLLL